IESSDSVPRVAIAQLPAVLHRPKYFAHRHLDDAAGHQLAGLSANRFGLHARSEWIRGADLRPRAFTYSRSLGRPMESPSNFDRNASPRHAAIASIGVARAYTHHQH